MDVILHLSTPRVKLVAEPGVSISRDRIYQLAGFNATDSAGQSLMSQIHLGPEGQFDGGFTPSVEGTVTISTFFEVGGTFYNVGKDITLDIEFPAPTVVAEPVQIATEPIEFDEFEQAFGSLGQTELTAPVSNTVPVADPTQAVITAQDDESQTYELSYRYGDHPGMYKIPDFRSKLEIPDGKRMVSATLVAYATDEYGDVIQDIQLANENYYDTDAIEWKSPFEEELPFGLDDGSGVYGLWFAIFVSLENAPVTPKVSAWGKVGVAKPAQPAINADEEPKAQAASDPQPVEKVVEAPAKPTSVWDDSDGGMPELDGNNEIPLPDLSRDPDLGATQRFDKTEFGPQAATGFAFKAEPGEPEIPALGGVDGTETEFDLDEEPVPAKGKQGLFNRGVAKKSAKTKTEKPAKAPKTVKPKKERKTKASGEKKSGKRTIIAIVTSVLVLSGLGGGGFMYYNSGVNEAKPLVKQVRETNKEIESYLKKDELSSEDTTELASLVQKQDEAFEKFKPNNFFAQNEENQMIKETQKLIDQVYAKVNK